MQTRNQEKMSKEQQTKEELDLIKRLESGFDETLKKESFQGIRAMIQNKKITEPIVFVLKNIKSFNNQVINDLIHLMRKYRASPYYLRINLMVGVRSGNFEELNMRVSIQNCVRMSIKKFLFPSMK